MLANNQFTGAPKMKNIHIKKMATAGFAVLALAACASKPEDIRTAYISTIQYEVSVIKVFGTEGLIN